ncbi:MAG: dihydroneopterin aldolase [Bacteroidales bacterium]|nr:dihydroneopterin aldolase [Bacteroidales bacterium]
MDKLSLKNLMFYAHHGCLDFEQKDGGWYRIDMDCFLDLTDAGQSDDLSKTVNYGALYSIVKRQMAVPSKLIENVARRILDEVKEGFPAIEHCSLTVTKINPPFEGEPLDYMGAEASVTLEF